MPASARCKWGSGAARFLLAQGIYLNFINDLDFGQLQTLDFCNPISSVYELFFAVLAIYNFHYTLGSDVSVNKDHPKRSKRDGDLFSSLHSLHHVKGEWLNITFELEEEDKGPFPKLIGGVFNPVSRDKSVEYSIDGPSVDGHPDKKLFFIKPSCGHVYVNDSIDREKTPSVRISFDVRLTATKEKLDNTLFLTVQIKDINDNAPQFLQRELNINITEKHNKNEPISIITAIDKDQEGTANSEVVYTVVSQTPHLKPPLFTIDSSSGLIRITRCLDYETDRTFRLLIRASDRGSPSWSSTATVNIAVKDSNNNLPVFTQGNYHVDVPEGRKKDNILRLRVEDKDSPDTPAWSAKYTIKTGNERGNFAIVTDRKTNEGVLSVIKPLVYGSPSVRRLVIVVENEESFFVCKSGIMSFIVPPQLPEVLVSINIIDQNDAPQFNPPILTIRRQEGVMAGTRLVQYVALDSDTAQENIRYKIVSDPGGWVTVSEHYGIVITTKTLDRESPFVNNSTYIIVIHAIDDGNPPLTGTGTILLYLTDINDNAPLLITSFLTICDGKEKGPFRIKAEDKDSYPYAEPFTFQLEEPLEGTEKLWRLGESSANSVDLFMWKSLPLGNYSVPLRVQDMQRFSKQQSLHVTVCSCPDGITCEEYPPAQPAQPQTYIGEGLIGGIVAIFLLLILGLALLLWCSCISKVAKSPAIIPYGEANQSLIHYSEESHPVLSQDTPDLGIHTTPSAVYANISKEKPQGLEMKLINNQPSTGSSHCNTTKAWNQLTGNQHLTGTSHFNTTKAWNQLETFNHQNVKTSRQNPHGNFFETVAVILKQKCNHIANLEDNVVSYLPHIYAEEGILEKSGSLLSLPVSEDDKNKLPDNFLDALGSTFIPLGEIYSK